MRRSFRHLFFVALGAAALAGASGQAWAHGSGWSQENSFAVVLSFYYADQSPIGYGEVEIFSPADSQIPYQKGRSDRNGIFSFKPDSPGLWSFAAGDGQGHLSKGEVEVTAEQLNITPAAAETGTVSPALEEQPLAKGGASADGIDPLKVVLGLSLIANLFLIFSRRRKGA